MFLFSVLDAAFTDLCQQQIKVKINEGRKRHRTRLKRILFVLIIVRKLDSFNNIQLNVISFFFG
jgi:hypothetical protein